MPRSLTSIFEFMKSRAIASAPRSSRCRRLRCLGLGAAKSSALRERLRNCSENPESRMSWNVARFVLSISAKLASFAFKSTRFQSVRSVSGFARTPLERAMRVRPLSASCFRALGTSGSMRATTSTKAMFSSSSDWFIGLERARTRRPSSSGSKRRTVSLCGAPRPRPRPVPPPRPGP